MNNNIYAIGDIHGNIVALNQILKRTPLQKGDTLIFLGDYGDGFKYTSEVVDKLLKLQKEYECIFLLGNHDIWIRDWLNTGVRRQVWEMQGGRATIDSYINTQQLANKDHHYFWNNLRLYYIQNNNLFVHGGWDGKQDFDKECKRIYQGYPTIVWDRTLAEKWFKPTKYTEKFNNIFIGHTATQTHLPEYNYNIWNLDSGAGWDGKLTIMNIKTFEYWQSDKNTKCGR